MTEFSEIKAGDTVVLKHKTVPSNVAQGVVGFIEDDYLSIEGFGSFYAASWEVEGYKRPRQLPTESGLYLSRSDTRAISSKTLYCLYGNLWSWDKGGEWEDVSSDKLPGDLIRLVPETEALKEVSNKKIAEIFVDNSASIEQAYKLAKALESAGILFRERA